MRALVSYGGLELRRNRLLYLGWPCVILGSLPFAAFVARLSAVSVHDGVLGLLWGWFMAGLPFSALLFGAVAGAGLRGRAEEDEAPLAVSPAARAFAGAGAAGAALLACGLLLAVAGLGVDPDAFALGKGFAEVCAVGAGFLLWMLTVAFTAAYALQSALLGGAAAAFASFFLGAGLGTTLAGVDPALGPAVLPAAYALTLLGTAGSLAAAAGLPRLPSRRWPRIALATLLPFTAVFAAWALEMATRPRVLPAPAAYKHRGPRFKIPKHARLQ